MEMGGRWIMKRNRVFQAIIMVFSSLLIIACAALASDEEKIQNRIETFAQAANEGDWDEMINMFDSNTREKVEAVVAFGNGMLGELSDVDLSFQDLYALYHGICRGNVSFWLQSPQTLRRPGIFVILWMKLREREGGAGHETDGALSIRAGGPGGGGDAPAAITGRAGGKRTGPLPGDHGGHCPAESEPALRRPGAHGAGVFPGAGL